MVVLLVVNMDYKEQLEILKNKDCERQFECKTAMPGPDATDAERKTYFEDPCHEQRAECYKDEIEAMNAAVLAPYYKKKEDMAIKFGAGMGVALFLLIVGIIVLVVQYRKLKKASKQLKPDQK